MQGLHDQRAHVAYRSLLARCGHGYPLWIPEPDDTLPESYRRTGINIGDVGLLTPDGGFAFIFNVHTSADDPIHDGNVPGDFVPLPWDKLGPHPVHQVSAMFRPQTSITSAEVKTRSLSIDVSAEAPGVAGGGFGLEFSTSRTQAAILTLPTGAARENVTNLSIYKEYAASHAKSWYRYVNGDLGRCATNGTLYLVTGCDKTDSWGTAAFCHRPENTTEVSLKFLAAGIGENSFSVTSTWDTTMGVETRIFPSPGLTVPTGYKNQCVFIRGFSIALRDNLVKRKVKGPARISLISGALHDSYPSFEGSIPCGSSSSSQLTVPGSSSSSTASHSLSRLALQLSGVRKQSTSDSEIEYANDSDSDGPSESEDNTNFSTALQVFPYSQILNPSGLISRRILDMCSDADVAVVHDEEWLHPLCTNTVNDIGIDLELILRDMQPTVTNGVGSLKKPRTFKYSPPGPSNIGTQLVHEAKQHWEQDPVDGRSSPLSVSTPPTGLPKSTEGEPSNELVIGHFDPFSERDPTHSTSRSILDVRDSSQKKRYSAVGNYDSDRQSSTGSSSTMSSAPSSERLGRVHSEFKESSSRGMPHAGSFPVSAARMGKSGQHGRSLGRR